MWGAVKNEDETSGQPGHCYFTSWEVEKLNIWGLYI